MYKRVAPVLLAILAGGLAEAQAAPPDKAPLDPPAEAGPHPEHRCLPEPPPFGMPLPGPGMHGGMPFAGGGPVADAVHTALEIEHLYREQGRAKEVASLYEDILAKSKNPALRHFAYESLAHAQMQPADADKAIAALRHSLDESLKLADEAPPPGPRP